MKSISKGIRPGQWDLDPAVFAQMALAVPSLAEQRAIADYLDRETAQIDTLIAKQEQLIATLRERADASWARQFEIVSERASGVVPLRRMVSSIVDGPFGSSLTSAHYAESGARVVRLGNVGINRFDNKDQAYIPMDYFSSLKNHEVLAGDVVMAGLGDERMPLGRSAVVPDIGPAIVKADCYRLRGVKGVSGDYLAWALSSPQARTQIARLARGATRDRLNTRVVLDIVLPLPSQDLQADVRRAASAETAKIDALIEKAERFIVLAKERRAALITAAVTGQIDVTEKAA